MTARATERTRVRRNAGRGVYDAATIHAILDSQRMCQVAFVTDGEPRIIPTLYFRDGDSVYLHGNRRSAMLRHLEAGELCALSVFAEDAIVVARSGFHCSMNYRSVVMFGSGELVTGAEKRRCLDRFVARLVPGHERAVREPTPQEVDATSVVRLTISEASAKVRTGDPVDDPGDLTADVWAGIVPLRQARAVPQPAADLRADIPTPAYLSEFVRGG